MAKNRRTPGGGAARRARQAREAVSEPVDGGLAQLLPDPDRANGWTLLVDGAPQSHVDLDDPTCLDFEYQRRFGHVADLVAPPGRPVHALHLGGGALTLARYVAATRARSSQQVVELDGALVQLVRRELPLERGRRIRIRSGDAREVLARIPDGWADLVVSDVFSGARTPAHLTSAEFLADARRTLRPGGLYTANLTDGSGASGASSGAGRNFGGGGGPRKGGGAGALAHLRAQTATAQRVFAEVCLIADPAVLRGRRFGNAVLVAADSGLPVAELTRRTGGDPHPGRVEYGSGLAAFAGGARPVTDAAAAPSPEPPAAAFR